MNDKRLMMVLMGVALVGAMASCTEPQGQLILLGHAPPQGPTCEPPPDGDTRSVLDLSLSSGDGYVLYARLQNNTPQALTITGATVAFSLVQPLSIVLPPDFFSPAGAVILSGETLVVPIELMDPSLVRILAQAPELLDDSGAPNPGAAFAVDVSIEPQARTLDEQAVKTSGMTRRMTFCVGCLVTHPLDALRETEDGALTCKALPDQEPVAVELPCVLGQDLPVDCRVCRALSATQEAADALCEP